MGSHVRGGAGAGRDGGHVQNAGHHARGRWREPRGGGGGGGGEESRARKVRMRKQRSHVLFSTLIGRLRRRESFKKYIYLADCENVRK